jgi:hypothetical protein
LPFAQRHAELAAVATSALLDDADYKRFLAEGRKLDSQAAVELALTILE